MSIKSKIKSYPFVRKIIVEPLQFIRKLTFKGSNLYWENLYKKGGNSGSGSYNQLAVFKAGIINSFVKEKNISTIIEFGCGDGNQLTYSEYPNYIGFDVSPSAISMCLKKFENDPSKSFFLYDTLHFLDNSHIFQADLVLSMDVIYHLIEDEVYLKYMADLFNASKKYVVIYSSNINAYLAAHEKHRNFSNWINLNKREWTLINKIENRYKYDKHRPDDTSMADFYIYEKNNHIE
jgi:SAM-dependent methyltransferase